MGEVLIAGTASLLICIFLSPKFISFLREREFGQIDELARIAEPDVGVITNIGPVHVELVGSLAGVAQAKAELLGHVPIAISIVRTSFVRPRRPNERRRTSFM